MAKDDKELQSFKIGDLRKPEVRRSATAQSDEAEPQEESSSVGFPAIESRLENGTVESVAEELRGVYSQLEELADSGNNKQKQAAMKAMGAYERTADLFEYLFATKEALASPPGDSE